MLTVKFRDVKIMVGQCEDKELSYFVQPINSDEQSLFLLLFLLHPLNIAF